MKNWITKGDDDLNVFFYEESKVLSTIFIITWLSLDDLRKDELYKSELITKWFPLETLLWALLKKYNSSEIIYEICHWEWYNSILERLIALKKHLIKIETIEWEVSWKVKLLLVKK